MYKIKDISGSVKDVDTKGRIVTGYFARYGNVDSDKDMFREGVFKKSITESGPSGMNRIAHLLQHDPNRPINKPMVLEERKDGLYFETKFPNTDTANDTLKLYQEGFYNEHSVGFNIGRSTKHPEMDDVQLITQAKLWEGSTVVWGANEQTPFLGFKAKNKKDAIKEKMSTIDTLLSKASFTDETFYKLQILNEQLKSLLEAPKSTPPKEGTLQPQNVVDLFDNYKLKAHLL